ncbi:hypothetical protein QQG55_35340 [Brugia pahangi]
MADCHLLNVSNYSRLALGRLTFKTQLTQKLITIFCSTECEQVMRRRILAMSYQEEREHQFPESHFVARITDLAEETLSEVSRNLNQSSDPLAVTLSPHL